MTEISEKTEEVKKVKKEYITKDDFLNQLMAFEDVIKKKNLDVFKKIRKQFEKNPLANVRTLLDCLIEENK